MLTSDQDRALLLLQDVCKKILLDLPRLVLKHTPSEYIDLQQGDELDRPGNEQVFREKLDITALDKL